MKKFLFALLIVIFFVGAACAESVKIGQLSKLNMSQEDFQARLMNNKNSGSRFFSATNANREDITIIFYDSLVSMQMALNADEIQEMILPEVVAEYIMNTSGNYDIAGIVRGASTSCLSLGFRAGDESQTLRDKINSALLDMKADGALAILKNKYIDEPGIGEPLPVKFEHYDGADMVKVAVTGDLPPIDYVAADGKPAGFNTAVLAEISKRLHINIELLNIESGARAAALASRRADIVFWMQSQTNAKVQPDIPEGITLSEPYYTWNEYLHLKKK